MLFDLSRQVVTVEKPPEATLEGIARAIRQRRFTLAPRGLSLGPPLWQAGSRRWEGLSFIFEGETQYIKHISRLIKLKTFQSSSVS
jgi:hypothetical protein